MNYTLRENELPDVEEYNHLRTAVGWRAIRKERAERDLTHTWYAVTAVNDRDETIGMGRLISNGGYVVMLVDMIVLPEYQGCGIGRQIMDKIKARVESEGSKDDPVMFALISAPGKEGFYRKFGLKNTEGSSMQHWSDEN